MIGNTRMSLAFPMAGSLIVLLIGFGVLVSVSSAGTLPDSRFRLPTNSSIQAVPHLEPVDCSSFQDAGLSSPNWQCGYVIVPENRKNPQSRTIKVAFAILKAPDANRQPDPVVYLEGGPGEFSIDGGWADRWVAPLGNRDLILVDPRGTGYSEPEMECPLYSPYANAQEQAPSVEENVTRYSEWAQNCRDLLTSQGSDLTAYSSMDSAGDLEALRQAFGYAQRNLYGVLYGTTTALVSMREYPEGIRSVVLDSVLPPQVDRMGDDVTSTAAAISKLFSDCQASPACNRDYPDLGTKFKGII